MPGQITDGYVIWINFAGCSEISDCIDCWVFCTSRFAFEGSAEHESKAFGDRHSAGGVLIDVVSPSAVCGTAAAGRLVEWQAHWLQASPRKGRARVADSLRGLSMLA